MENRKISHLQSIALTCGEKTEAERARTLVEKKHAVGRVEGDASLDSSCKVVRTIFCCCLALFGANY